MWEGEHITLWKYIGICLLTLAILVKQKVQEKLKSPKMVFVQKKTVCARVLSGADGGEREREKNNEVC